MPPAATIPANAAISGTFLNVLSALDRGAVVNDLDDALRDATRAAAEAGAKAKVTLELTIIPNGTGAGETPLFKVIAKPKVVLPQVPRTPSSFFIDENGNLTRRNPRQEEMRLESIDGGKVTRADLQQQSAVAGK